ncbi:MAG TPA: cell wall hydrolase, partial [Pseudolabrys sp.]
MLTRNTVRYSGPTAGEKFFHGAQRACTVFAVSALMLGLFDLANIRSVEGAAAFFNDNCARVANLPDRIRSGIEFISFEQEASATVAIPRDIIKTAASPIARLAAVRHEDAVAFAMSQPGGKDGSKFGSGNLTNSELRAADPDPQSALASAPIQLASVDMESVPSETAPISLPMSAAIPLGMVPMPRPAPGVPPPSPAERLHLEGKERARAERCLANAIYFEARSEPIRGQMAVAQVVVNRAFSGFYPNDICGVVYQNAGRHLAC